MRSKFMLRRLCAAMALFELFSAVHIFAQYKSSFFDIDLNYLGTGFLNNGWGLGVAYEHKVFDHVSVKGGFGHMTFKTFEDGIYCTTANISAVTLFYPLSEDLNGLYIGAGCSTDFLNYFGPAVVQEKTGDTIIYLNTILGWKLYMLKNLMADINVGYNLEIERAANYEGFDRYGKKGLQYGIGIKLIF